MNRTLSLSEKLEYLKYRNSGRFLVLVDVSESDTRPVEGPGTWAFDMIGQGLVSYNFFDYSWLSQTRCALFFDEPHHAVLTKLRWGS